MKRLGFFCLLWCLCFPVFGQGVFAGKWDAQIIMLPMKCVFEFEENRIKITEGNRIAYTDYSQDDETKTIVFNLDNYVFSLTYEINNDVIELYLNSLEGTYFYEYYLKMLEILKEQYLGINELTDEYYMFMKKQLLSQFMDFPIIRLKSIR